MKEAYEDENENSISLFSDENRHLNLNSFKIIDGKLPVNKNEIAIDDLSKTNIGISEEKLNQTIEI